MDEMRVLINDAKSGIIEMSEQIEAASNVDSTDDIKDAIHAAIRSGEEARDRLEEAEDFADYEEYESAIEDTLEFIEDAIDSAKLTLIGTESLVFADEAQAKLAMAIAALNRLTKMEAG